MARIIDFTPTEEQFGVFWKYLEKPDVTELNFSNGMLWITSLWQGRYAVEETVSDLMEEKNYDITSENEMIADMVEDLSRKLDSNSDITVNIENIDVAKGLMSIKVVASYQHPNGKEGSVSCERTVVFNKLQDNPAELCQVRFLVDDARIYKTCNVWPGDTVSAPSEPTVSGKTFECWVDVEGNPVDFTQSVTQSQIYYAKYS